ncbi:hypothetical protein SIID45300_01359 [Candidatus Magnetaquicoccaceae bacterium FCR-1]|uniref:ABC-type sugar transport system, ATPase component n=1 Tax=Candidatus Magnetaquiglobus chichijimensis TaxID=3141448 RepID=A0ABQ0C821_9PROT
MNRSSWSLQKWLIGFFCIASVLVTGWFNANKPRLVILQSYDKSYSWTKDVNIGINRVLDAHRDYTINWYYLDTKRHPWTEFKTNAGQAMRRMLNASPPDVLLAVDDDAQQFVTRHLLNHPTIRIVFSGVNNPPEDYGFDKADNITGILERKPWAALRETLLILAEYNNLKKPLTIQFLGDQSDSVIADEIDFREFDMTPIQVVDSRLVNTFAEWKQALAESAGKVDFLITTNYRKIKRTEGSNDLMPPRELIDWSEKHSPTPLIGTNAFYAEDGGMLAIGTSPYEQGEVAAHMVVELLSNDKSPKQLPMRSTEQFVVAVRSKLLADRNLKLPKVYESAARSINKYY